MSNFLSYGLFDIRSFVTVKVRLPRTFTIGLAVIATFTAIALTYPGGMSIAYNDLVHYQSHKSELDHAKQTDAQLDDVNQRIANRIAIKDGIIADLISERVSLNQAVRLFLQLNGTDERLMGVLREAYPGRNDEERIARNVLDYMRQRVGQNENSQIEMGRIEAEFERLFGSPI